jgi:hypothetical protein
MKQLAVVLVALVAVASPRVGEAQGRGNDKARDIPVSARPPAGMCRVWLDDVPVAQQPAPTDCPTAVRNRSPKSRVIFGDDYVQPQRRDTSKKSGTKAGEPAIKGFAPSSRKPPFGQLLRRP